MGVTSSGDTSQSERVMTSAAVSDCANLLSSKMASSIYLVLLLLGSTNTAKLTNLDEEEVNKQTDKVINEEIKKQEKVSNGLNLNSLLSFVDIDLDKMAAGAEDVVRRFAYLIFWEGDFFLKLFVGLGCVFKVKYFISK